ncbi:hypothetical protein BG011_003291 [Mortierella polycephala]|uniref:FHA domain-containing protein n=1 Tax=Mortierella polycephala TaxID=41804 RepID=A0A9P6QEH2_9FUNG|nr:hypothetical protein BG011_003291 [Mortierella polycephala]
MDGLDLLLKAAHDNTNTNNQQQDRPVRKKSKVPSMILVGSYGTPVIVGRGSQATLNLGRVNKQVSRRHAIVQWCSESSAFQITVLGQNGVRINGSGFPSGQQATLHNGDIVDLVGVKMVFRAPSEQTPQQDYQNTEDLQDHFDLADGLVGMSTPKRSHDLNADQHQLLTPSRSTPIQDISGSPLTPTARMRHKMSKYDLSPVKRNMFHSPPPSSDTGIEFDSSPLRSRPVFTLPMDDMPPRKPIFDGLENSESESNIFLDDDSSVNPFKSTTQRVPLAPMSLTENRKSCQPKAQPTANRTSTAASTPLLAKSPATAPVKSSKTQPKPSVGKKDAENRVPTTLKEEKVKVAANPVKPGKEAFKAKEAKRTTRDANIKPKKVLTPSTVSKENSTKESSRPHKAEQNSSAQTLQSKSPRSKEATLAAKDQENDEESSPKASVKKSPMDYTEMIIDTLVFARKKKSMTLTELFDEMVMSQPSLMATHSSEEIKEQMLQCLSAARCVGKITRKGKDAYNKPLENQWYYIPECDHNVMRKLTRQEVMPSARKCTLKDKQYFFKMPPKLPYHRKSASPYAVKPTARRGKDSSKLSTAAEASSASSSDAEEEAGEVLKPARKRKSVISGHTDKKRKGEVRSVTAEEVEKDEDDAQDDSLDDLSELSGLSD